MNSLLFNCAEVHASYCWLNARNQIEGAVIISGSPGLIDTVERKIRKAKDESNARALVAYGLDYFLDTWYAGDLWRRWVRFKVWIFLNFACFTPVRLLAACQGSVYPSHYLYSCIPQLAKAPSFS